MAEKLEYRLTVSYYMSNTNPKSRRNTIANFACRIKAVSAQAYLAAADTAARAATTVGVLITATNLLTIGIPAAWAVALHVVDLAATPPEPDDFVFSFDKFAASLVAAGENSQITIPARNDGVVTVESDGVSLDLTDTQVAAWIAAFEAIALDEDLNSPTVNRMFVTS